MTTKPTHQNVNPTGTVTTSRLAKLNTSPRQARRPFLRRPEFLRAIAAHLLVITSIVVFSLGLATSTQASVPIFTISCAPDTTIECPATPNFQEPVATGACTTGPVILDSSDTTTPGTCPGTYSVKRTWTATDDCN